MSNPAQEDPRTNDLHVAVTGASGCIGRALVARLQATPGVTVRALLRANGDQSSVDSSRWHQTVHGDLHDRGALWRLARGTDVVFHCAATMSKSDAEHSRRVNVEGTVNLLHAARDAGVRRFVFISSISVFAATRSRDGIVTEATEPAREQLLNHYSRTKLEAERRVRQLAGDDIEYTIVRPTNVYGPLSRPWFRQWADLLGRTRYVMGDIPIDIVHSDDVATALVQAGMSRAARNEVFHIGNERIQLNAFVERVAKVVALPSRRIPASLDRALRATIENGYRLATGHVMSLSLTRPAVYPHEKAARTFGYAPSITADDGFASLTEWYRSQCRD